MRFPKPIELDSGPEPEQVQSAVRLVSFNGTHAAVDIPVEVIGSLVIEVLSRDLASPAKTEAIFDAAAQSLGRLGMRIRPRFH